MKGRLIKEDDKVLYKTSEKFLTCSNCSKKIKNKDPMYLCQIGRKTYCMCWRERVTPVCFQGMFQEHTDIFCNLVVV